MISTTSPPPNGASPAVGVEITPQVFMLNAPHRRVPFVAINTAQAAKVCAAAFDATAAAAGRLSWRFDDDDGGDAPIVTWHLLRDGKATTFSLMSVKDTLVSEDVALTLLIAALPGDTRHVYQVDARQLPLTPELESALETWLMIPF